MESNTPKTTAALETQGHVTIEIPGANDKKAGLLRAFFEKFRYKLELQNQPSEQTLAILLKMHKAKSAEFIPLSKVANAFDNKDMRVEPTKIQGTPLMLDNNAMNAKQKVTFNLSPENFVNSVRVLMMGYVLVSVNDPPGQEWCTLEAAMAHVDCVEQYSRLDSLANHQMHQKIMEIEMSIRTEWSRICQFHAQFSLSDAINLVASRNTWPLISDFKAITWKGDKGNRQDKGGKKGKYSAEYAHSQLLQQEKNRLKRGKDVHLAKRPLFQFW